MHRHQADNFETTDVPYRIEWVQRGAIKHFSGNVTFQDVYQSECDIQISPAFDHFRFVISVFEGVLAPALSESQIDDLLALRLGALSTNPRIKYAYVACNQDIKTLVATAVKKSNAALAVKMFDNLHDAVTWVLEQSS